MQIIENAVVVPLDRYNQLIEAETLLEATKRVVMANGYDMPETLSNLLDVYLEEKE